MNKRSLGGLIALNVVLLVALVLVSITPEPAYAQLARPEYVMVNGAIRGRGQSTGVYIIELSTSRMVCLFYSSADNRIDIAAGRDMTRDMQAVQNK